MATENKYIGEMLPKPDWETARDMVSSQHSKGFVYLAKPGGQYAGKVLLMSDTHMVQQVGANKAVAHDLSKLDNGQDISKRFDEGEIQLRRTSLSVKYGQERGTADVLTYNQQRADAVRAQAEKWAEQNITNVESREAFVKNVHAFTQDMAKGKEPTKTQTPAKEQQQGRNQDEQSRPGNVQKPERTR